jgi:hypothetical protein
LWVIFALLDPLIESGSGSETLLLEIKKRLFTNDDPAAATKLCKGRQVDNDGLFVLRERVHNVGAELDHLVEHVLHAAGEAAPVGQDDEGEALAAEVVDGLGRLKGGVGEPDLARLAHRARLAFRIGRVRGQGHFHRSLL